MGADMLTAALMTTGQPITVTNLRPAIMEKAATLTYGQLFGDHTENIPFVEDLFTQLLNDGANDPEREHDIIPADVATSVTDAVLEMVDEIATILDGRSVNCHEILDGSHIYVTGGESWGDSPAECDAFWAYSSLEQIFDPGIYTLVGAWPLHAAPLVTTAMSPGMIARAAVESTDPDVRLAAAGDPFLPLTAEQVDALAHDPDPRVRAATAERISDSLSGAN